MNDEQKRIAIAALMNDAYGEDFAMHHQQNLFEQLQGCVTGANPCEMCVAVHLPAPPPANPTELLAAICNVLRA